MLIDRGGGGDMENQNRANYVKLVAYTRRDMETKFHPPPPPPPSSSSPKMDNSKIKKKRRYRFKKKIKYFVCLLALFCWSNSCKIPNYYYANLC